MRPWRTPSKRIQKLGYVGCLHDNVQDMYRDAKSWDPSYIEKKPDGSLIVGGRWNGGRAYMVCAPKQLELAQRPQNLGGHSRAVQAVELLHRHDLRGRAARVFRPEPSHRPQRRHRVEDPPERLLRATSSASSAASAAASGPCRTAISSRASSASAATTTTSSSRKNWTPR